MPQLRVLFFGYCVTFHFIAARRFFTFFTENFLQKNGYKPFRAFQFTRLFSKINYFKKEWQNIYNKIRTINHKSCYLNQNINNSRAHQNYFNINIYYNTNTYNVSEIHKTKLRLGDLEIENYNIWVKL